jgi:hypothetical protein
VAVAPNPFINELNIKGAEGYTLNLTNIVGISVYRRKISSDNETVFVGNIPAGIYVATLTKNGERMDVKLIKER